MFCHSQAFISDNNTLPQKKNRVWVEQICLELG